ncbi:MAG: hypothetical protein JSS66_18920 [Armatimonadetes bacterium]|nr:hypothetical protein [Armatimonadota bacterium]
MKRILLAAPLVMALAGCQSSGLDGFQKFVDFLSSPQTTQAVANLQAGSRALVCALSNAAAVATQVEQAVEAGEAAIGTTGKVFTASAIVCASLGGTVTGTATVK